MSIKDFAGNDLSVGDLIVVKPPFVVAQITAIDDGSILQGLSLTGPKPEARQTIPQLRFMIQMPGASMIVGGQCPDVLKVQKPDNKTSTGDGQ